MKSKIEEIILFDYEELKKYGNNEQEIIERYEIVIDDLKKAFHFCSSDIKRILKEYHAFFYGYPCIHIDETSIYCGDIVNVENVYGVNPIEVWHSYMNGGAVC